MHQLPLLPSANTQQELNKSPGTNGEGPQNKGFEQEMERANESVAVKSERNEVTKAGGQTPNTTGATSREQSDQSGSVKGSNGSVLPQDSAEQDRGAHESPAGSDTSVSQWLEGTADQSEIYASTAQSQTLSSRHQNSDEKLASFWSSKISDGMQNSGVSTEPANTERGGNQDPILPRPTSTGNPTIDALSEPTNSAAFLAGKGDLDVVAANSTANGVGLSANVRTGSMPGQSAIGENLPLEQSTLSNKAINLENPNSLGQSPSSLGDLSGIDTDAPEGLLDTRKLNQGIEASKYSSQLSNQRMVDSQARLDMQSGQWMGSEMDLAAKAQIDLLNASGIDSETSVDIKIDATSSRTTTGLADKPNQAASAKPYVSSLPLPVESDEWAMQLSQKLAWLGSRNIQSAELHLNPADLGPIEVRIQLGSDQSSISFSSQNATVRELLEANIHRLRDMMSEQSATQQQASQDSPGDQGQDSQYSSQYAGTFEDAGNSEQDDLAQGVAKATQSNASNDSIVDAYI